MEGNGGGDSDAISIRCQPIAPTKYPQWGDNTVHSLPSAYTNTLSVTLTAGGVVRKVMPLHQ
jgi:hypothetical protein